MTKPIIVTERDRELVNGRIPEFRDDISPKIIGKLYELAAQARQEGREDEWKKTELYVVLTEELTKNLEAAQTKLDAIRAAVHSQPKNMVIDEILRILDGEK